jgi:hypothetical protein
MRHTCATGKGLISRASILDARCTLCATKTARQGMARGHLSCCPIAFIPIKSSLAQGLRHTRKLCRAPQRSITRSRTPFFPARHSFSGQYCSASRLVCDPSKSRLRHTNSLSPGTIRSRSEALRRSETLMRFLRRFSSAAPLYPYRWSNPTKMPIGPSSRHQSPARCP